MSAQELPDTPEELVSRVQSSTRDKLAQLFLKYGANPDTLGGQLDRLIRVIAVFVDDAARSFGDRELFRKIALSALSAQRTSHQLSAQLNALIALDPIMVDGVLVQSRNAGRLGPFAYQLQDLDEQLSKVLAEFQRHDEGRPKHRTLVFEVACEIWLAQCGSIPPIHNASKIQSPLHAFILAIASEMFDSGDVRAALSFGAFKRVRADLANRLKGEFAEHRG